MQHGYTTFGLQFGERLFQANGVTDGFLDEFFNERLTLRVQHSPAEAAAETGDSGKTDSCNFDGLAIEHNDARVIENFTDELGLSRLEIVVAHDRKGWNSHGSANIGDEFFRLVVESIICEIAAKQQDIGGARYRGERFVQRPARMLAIMKIRSCGDS